MAAMAKTGRFVLTQAQIGQKCRMVKINGSPAMKRRLADFGFAVGMVVTVVAAAGGDLIVKVHEGRVAVAWGLANRILIEQGAEK